MTGRLCQACRMSPAALDGCYVISLRPAGEHASLRRAAAAHGARVLALSPWKLLQRDDAATRATLRAALAAERVVFTSPAAVRAALALQALRLSRGAIWCAVGAGTASMLRHAGVAAVLSPTRMDSEGLLALPAMTQVRECRVGLVTAPGGRGRIAATLRRRGALLLRANVYERVPVVPPARTVQRLLELDAPSWLALSSGEALERIVSTLPSAACVQVRRARVVAASERLAGIARGHGFTQIVVAASARPHDLMLAAATAMRRRLLA